MKFIIRLFQKKTKPDIYSRMGSIGVSPAHMKMYEESVKRMKEV